MKTTSRQHFRLRQRNRTKYDDLEQQMAESLDRLHEMTIPIEFYPFRGTVAEQTFH